MDPIAVVSLCKQLGCCDACCLRFLGHKNPNAYEDSSKFILKYKDTKPTEEIDSVPADVTNTENNRENGNTTPLPNQDDDNTTPLPNEEDGNTAPLPNKEDNGHTAILPHKEDGTDIGSPPAKRQKMNHCVCCLGILQPDTWPQCFEKVKEVLHRKGYSNASFACALSAPLSALLRERAVSLRLKQRCPQYDTNILTPLKEAWKWSFGVSLAMSISRSLCSGADCPLLITVHMEYDNETQELAALQSLSPALFRRRAQQRQRFTALVTRRAVEQALDGLTLPALTALQEWSSVPLVRSAVRCSEVQCAHQPMYIAGRYVKLSRSLPQTPWLVNGQRMMTSSVQEIITQPIADIYNIPASEMSSRLKFLSAGREDVDVRCLGNGRPFAIEVSDPVRSLSASELSAVCERVNTTGDIKVANLTYVTREELSLLKKGEENKAKTYHALCVKLTHHESGVCRPSTVTPEDISLINSYTNTSDPGVRVAVTQRTPLRVLHRRPLLARRRNILELHASLVPDHPHLFGIKVVTEAGTYIKEWVHGECGRTVPALADAFRGKVDHLRATGDQTGAIHERIGAIDDNVKMIDHMGAAKGDVGETGDHLGAAKGYVTAIGDHIGAIENHGKITDNMEVIEYHVKMAQDRMGATEGHVGVIDNHMGAIGDGSVEKHEKAVNDEVRMTEDNMREMASKREIGDEVGVKQYVASAVRDDMKKPQHNTEDIDKTDTKDALKEVKLNSNTIISEISNNDSAPVSLANVEKLGNDDLATTSDKKVDLTTTIDRNNETAMMNHLEDKDAVKATMNKEDESAATVDTKDELAATNGKKGNLSTTIDKKADVTEEMDHINDKGDVTLAMDHLEDKDAVKVTNESVKRMRHELATTVDIVSLDVVAVHLEWPPGREQ